MATIGERIEELRTEKGLKREELAHELGVSPGTVAHWEQGVQIPGRDKNSLILENIADFFQVPYAYIIGATDSREWPDVIFGDEDAAEAAQADDRALEVKMFKRYRDLDYEMQELVRHMVYNVYDYSKKRGRLRSQQED